MSSPWPNKSLSDGPPSIVRKPVLLLAVPLLLTSCQHGTGSGGPRWTSAGKFAERPSAGYVVRNNVWGKGPGPQTIWANSFAQWGVRAAHPETTGIKAYPHAGWKVHRRLSALERCTSRFAVTVPAAGSYNSAYDIWCEQHAFEMMPSSLWRIELLHGRKRYHGRKM